MQFENPSFFASHDFKQGDTQTTINEFYKSNNRSALEHSDFVSSAVCDLLKFGLVSEVLTLSSVVNLFLKKGD